MNTKNKTYIIKTIISLFFSLSLVLSTNISSYAYEIDGNNANIDNLYSVSIQGIIDEYINTFPEFEDEILGTVEIIMKTSSFISALQYDEDIAYELLRDGLDNLVGYSSISTYGTNYMGLFYANYTVPVVKQSTAVNCGIAAALQACIGNGYLQNTSENKSADKMTELAGYVSYNENGATGAQAWQVNKAMNRYGANIYDPVCITRYNIDHILVDLQNSFVNGHCPIITLNDTSKLSYYNGHSYKHWVTIAQIDDIHETVMLVDSFNSDICGGEASFGGIHLVTYDEFIEAINVNCNDCWMILDT